MMWAEDEDHNFTLEWPKGPTEFAVGEETVHLDFTGDTVELGDLTMSVEEARELGHLLLSASDELAIQWACKSIGPLLTKLHSETGGRPPETLLRRMLGPAGLGLEKRAIPIESGYWEWNLMWEQTNWHRSTTHGLYSKSNQILEAGMILGFEISDPSAIHSIELSTGVAILEAYVQNDYPRVIQSGDFWIFKKIFTWLPGERTIVKVRLNEGVDPDGLKIWPVVMISERYGRTIGVRTVDTPSEPDSAIESG